MSVALGYRLRRPEFQIVHDLQRLVNIAAPEIPFEGVWVLFLLQRSDSVFILLAICHSTISLRAGISAGHQVDAADS
jgi:hypothetical protein